MMKKMKKKFSEKIRINVIMYLSKEQIMSTIFEFKNGGMKSNSQITMQTTGTNKRRIVKSKTMFDVSEGFDDNDVVFRNFSKKMVKRQKMMEYDDEYIDRFM